MTANLSVDENSVPARYYAQLLTVLQNRGIDPLPIFEDACIAISRLSSPESRLKISELDRLVAALISRADLDDIPLAMGREIHLRNHSIVGFALISSPSVDYGLRLIARFFRLIYPAFRMRYSVNEKTAEVSFTPNMPMSADSLVFNIQLLAAAAHTVVEELYNEKLPYYNLQLSIQPPTRLADYKKWIPQARPEFASLARPGLCLTLPAAIVRREPTMANQESLVIAEQRCRVLVEQMANTGNTGGWVRMMLRESADGVPSIEEVAGILNISTRTLHRYLKREGLIYRTLCFEERARKACDMLATTGLSITRIAQELGYSDTANFNRAFRKYSGGSPSDYRENPVARHYF